METKHVTLMLLDTVRILLGCAIIGCSGGMYTLVNSDCTMEAVIRHIIIPLAIGLCVIIGAASGIFFICNRKAGRLCNQFNIMYGMFTFFVLILTLTCYILYTPSWHGSAESPYSTAIDGFKYERTCFQNGPNGKQQIRLALSCSVTIILCVMIFIEFMTFINHVVLECRPDKRKAHLQKNRPESMKTEPEMFSYPAEYDPTEYEYEEEEEGGERTFTQGSFSPNYIEHKPTEC